jgi:hypothetical protein
LALDVERKTHEAQQKVENIITDVRVIKDKANESEKLVGDMAKDIKALDLAKKNLVFVIGSLKNFIKINTILD